LTRVTLPNFRIAAARRVEGGQTQLLEKQSDEQQIAAERDAIIRKTHKVLNPEGAFLVYQVSGAVGPHLQRVFSNVDRDYEPLNLLPAKLFYCVP
jgi:hypothetical protein